MIKFIILCLCVSLTVVTCEELQLEEGADCEWEGVKGRCAKETQCLTTLERRGDNKPPVCTTKGEVTVVCCTDCELVNDTRNVVVSPTGGFYWKDGTKARDNCLEYLRSLPYRCRDGGYNAGVSRHYDREKKCHTKGIWIIGGAPHPRGLELGAKYPHQALLGFGEDLASAEWLAGGSIISKRYILTAANTPKGIPKFVALGVRKRTDPPSFWQTHEVKTFIQHPHYEVGSKYNDIALIETETEIILNKNVLPACLHVEAAYDLQAVTTTWRHLTSEDHNVMAETLQEINLQKLTQEKCKAAFASANSAEEIDFERQLCYGSKTHAPEATRGLVGEPLLIVSQFHCIFAIVGVTIQGSGPYTTQLPNIYTRVAHYKPWIESVVWA